MATVIWNGAAKAVKQITTVTPANVNIGNTFSVTIGNKTLTFTATAGTVANVTAGLLALVSDTDAPPEFKEVTWTDQTTYLKAVGNTAGFPVLISSSATGGTATNTTANTTACSGPNFLNVAANYQGGSLPASTDTLILRGSIPILHGLDLNAVALAKLVEEESYTGYVGLPEMNANGYPEYRDRYMKISATTAYIRGKAGRFRWNVGSSATTLYVNSARQSIEENVPPILIIGSNASNVLNINRGNIGLAYYEDETTQWPTIRQGWQSSQDSDTNVVIGPGATLGTITKTGGKLLTRSSVATSISNSGGTANIEDAAAVPTLLIEGGAVNYNSSGTLGTATVAGKGKLDFTGDLRTKTVTNSIQVYGPDAQVIDDNEVVTNLRLVLNEEAGLNGQNWRLGRGITLTRS